MVEEDFTILDQVPSVVHINVGGQLFLTSRETLLKVPNSLFCKMFQGDVAVKKVKQTDNVYFVDRDPTHFQRVLNFLRDGSCVLPSGAEQRKELLVEARHYQLPDLEDQVSDSLADAALEDLRLDFRSIVLRHHAATGDLNRLIEVFLGFVRSHLVTITPMTDVNDESRLHVYWLSATLPPSKPSCVAFRYRGEKEANDVGVTVNESDDSFAQWARLWDLYHSKQLVTTFKALMQRCGLKVHFASRVETFKQDSQLDVVWKMYRVRSLSLAISHLACT